MYYTLYRSLYLTYPNMENVLFKFTVVDGTSHVAVDPVEADAAPVRVSVPWDAHLIFVPHGELDRERLRTQKSEKKKAT